MSNLPRKCLMDTNVPKIANRSIDPANIPDELTNCVLACVNAVASVLKNGGLVIDSGDEIFTEYRQQLSFSGQPGVGDNFMKWVHDNRYKLPATDRVTITKNGKSYDELPIHSGLTNFDNSDRKFIAVANAHSDKPPILQATDSKWWGFKTALNEVGITVKFLCPVYIETKYNKKKKF